MIVSGTITIKAKQMASSKFHQIKYKIILSLSCNHNSNYIQQ